MCSVEYGVNWYTLLYIYIFFLNSNINSAFKPLFLPDYFPVLSQLYQQTQFYFFRNKKLQNEISLFIFVLYD